MVMTAYPVAGKQKSKMLCEAFMEGANRKETAAVFYGINATNYEAWRNVLTHRIPFYYIDNSYFDAVRGVQFRVTKNAIQYKGSLTSTGERLAHLRLPMMQPWIEITDTSHVTICMQSDTYMRYTVGWPDGAADFLKHMGLCCQRAWPQRPLRVRGYFAEKKTQQQTLARDLDGCAFLVTHSSAAAVAALLAGVRTQVFPHSAVYDCDNGWREGAEDLRLDLMMVLADNQWTIDEMKKGLAYRWINSHDPGTHFPVGPELS